jgi:hypothetical protein
MSEELSVDQRVHLLASSDDERMAFFVKQVKQSEMVWSLSNEEGFVMVETDEGDCVMVWPDAEFAAQWAVDDWDDCEPVSVPFTEFKSNWLPSLEADNIDVAVFPNIEDEGKLIKAKALSEALAD